MDGQDSVSSRESTTTDAFFCVRSMGLKRHIIMEDDLMSANRPQSSQQRQTKKKRARGPLKGLKSSTKADGTFVPTRHDDVLSRALGKKDHTGRALGVGGRLGIKAVWGSGPRPKTKTAGSDFVSRAEMDEKMAEWAERVKRDTVERCKANFEKKFEKIFEKKFEKLFQEKMMGWAAKFGFVEANTVDPITPQDPSSCQPVNSFSALTTPVPCHLMLLLNGSKKVTVAEGTVHPQLNRDHNSSLRPDHVKVTVDDYCKDYAYAAVPVPNMGVKKLFQAHGTFTQWPKQLISLVSDKELNPEIPAKIPNDLRKEVFSTNCGARVPLLLLQIKTSFSLLRVTRRYSTIKMNGVLTFS